MKILSWFTNILVPNSTSLHVWCKQDKCLRYYRNHNRMLSFVFTTQHEYLYYYFFSTVTSSQDWLMGVPEQKQPSPVIGKEQELFTLAEHLSSSRFSEVLVARSWVFFAAFSRWLFVLLFFFLFIII
jgi:hypothetical protein